MQITVNGERYLVDEQELTVSKLLVVKQVESPEMVSVQVNGDIVDRERFETLALNENDEVDFLYFMGGGAR